MPNLTYMAVQWTYLTALAVWIGGMVAFAALFAPSLTAVLERPQAGRVVADFLGRFRKVVIGCMVVLLVTSLIKFIAWENLTPWLLLRWGALAGMFGLAVYDFGSLAPRLAAARAAEDQATFGRLHKTAVSTMSATLLLGLLVLFVS